MKSIDRLIDSLKAAANVQLQNVISVIVSSYAVNPLERKGNYTATASNMKLAHWTLIGGLLH